MSVALTMAVARLFVPAVVVLASGTSLKVERVAITDSGIPVIIPGLPGRFPGIIPGQRKGKGLSGGFGISSAINM